MMMVTTVAMTTMKTTVAAMTTTAAAMTMMTTMMMSELPVRLQQWHHSHLDIRRDEENIRHGFATMMWMAEALLTPSQGRLSTRERSNVTVLGYYNNRLVIG